MNTKENQPCESSYFNFPRDFKGYGRKPPNFQWPGNPKIIVNFVVNYEEGAEMSVLNGDESSEQYIWELPYVAHKGVRSYDCESDFEYGSRVGIWRLLRAFDKFGWKFTTFGVGKAFELLPEVAKVLVESGHEIASHCYRWYDYSKFTAEEEKALINKNMDCFEKLFGYYPKGWYYARLSEHSYRLVYDVYKERGAKLLWLGDSYCDDLPYYKPVPNTHDALLMIPYSYDNNDARFHMPTGWSSSEDFYIHLKNSFDCLYDEGSELGIPKMMTVALHTRVISKPGRMPALLKFMEYVQKKEKDVWIATREEIANHFRSIHPYNSA